MSGRDARMTDPDLGELMLRIEELRQRAVHIRRLARDPGSVAGNNDLLAYAEKIEADIARLEAQVAGYLAEHH